MVSRALLAGSALALLISGCSGKSDDAAQTDGEPAAMTSPVAPPPAATPTPTDTPSAAPTDDSDTPEATPSPSPTPSPAATPTKVAAAAPAPAAVAAAPAAYGRCAVCHNADKGGADKLGPNLWGVYGSKAGQGGFAYSDPLKNSGLTWDEATLHKWLENPRTLVPGNRMSFPGIKDAAKRQEIIDYLKRQR